MIAYWFYGPWIGPRTSSSLPACLPAYYRDLRYCSPLQLYSLPPRTITGSFLSGAVYWIQFAAYTTYPTAYLLHWLPPPAAQRTLPASSADACPPVRFRASADSPYLPRSTDQFTCLCGYGRRGNITVRCSWTRVYWPRCSSSCLPCWILAPRRMATYPDGCGRYTFGLPARCGPIRYGHCLLRTLRMRTALPDRLTTCRIHGSG